MCVCVCVRVCACMRVRAWVGVHLVQCKVCSESGQQSNGEMLGFKS